MNYIHQLEDTTKGQESELTALYLGLIELEAHLNLPKFKQDTTIQTGDVRRWIEKIRNEARDARTETDNAIFRTRRDGGRPT